MELVIHIVFLVEILLIAKIERYIWGTYYTPTLILLLPFATVWLTAAIFAPAMKFVAVNTDALIIWMFGIFVFWISGLFVNIILRRILVSREIFSVQIDFKADINDKIINLMSIFFSFIFIVGFVVTLKKMGINALGSTEFAEEYAGGGLIGHLQVLNLPIIVYHLLTYKNKKILKTLFLIVSFGVLLIYEVKGWIILPIITYFLILFWQKKIKLTLKFIFFLMLFTFVLFIISYYMELVMTDKAKFGDKFMEFVGQHFVYYFYSGVLGFSEFIRNGYTVSSDTQPLFAPFINLVNVVTGTDLVSAVNTLRIPIDTVPHDTNVYTFFGTIYFYTGLKGVFFVGLGSGLAFHITYFVSITLKNKWVVIYTFLLLGLLSFGWFEYYLFHLMVVEIPFFCLGLSLFFAIIEKLRYKYPKIKDKISTTENL